MPDKKGVFSHMMTPVQTIEEVQLFLENLDLSAFNANNLVDLLDVLNRVECLVGQKLREDED